MKIAVLPEQGGSLRNLSRTGQEERFISAYLKGYGKVFERVTYFSYESEPPREGDSWTLVPNRWHLHRWLYAFSMPFLNRRIFRKRRSGEKGRSVKKSKSTERR